MCVPPDNIRPSFWDVDSYFVHISSVDQALQLGLLAHTDLCISGHAVSHQDYNPGSDMCIVTSGMPMRTSDSF